ncbi:tetratricopeptide repeat protein [uncultured Victivallis sp.]|uniref:tetratricopeptide repeat protein n=1 Tax=uncultured Victivallis sp. TaxID=354118 RepID=UPI0025958C44|nr:tetratricopeptide repeat protein [uncultured Victivallis sp.]
MKCCLLIVFILFLSMSYATEIPYAQALLNEREQVDQGFVRQRKHYNTLDAQRISNESCERGWKFLFQDKNLPLAMNEFNKAWRFNPDNYQVYWGSGIICSIQGEIKSLAQEKFLNQGIILLKKALDLSNNNNRHNIALDLANAYNGLGIMMLNNENHPKAIQLFDKSQEILNSVIKEDSKNGRAHFLLSVTYFYKSDFSNAKHEAKLALNDNFKIPEKYLEKLDLNMINPASK